jgi:hypothetical protein
MLMLRQLSVVILLSALAGPVQAAGLEQMALPSKGIDEIVAEEALRRSELFLAIGSENRITALRAMAELRGGYSDDPALVEAAIAIVAQGARASDEDRKATLTKRGNALNLLLSAEESAWTPRTVAQALEMTGQYRKSVAMGRPIDLPALVQLQQKLQGLTGVRTAYGDVQGRTEGGAQFTDVDVFICADQTENVRLVMTARSFAETLAKNDFGRVRLRPSTVELEKALTPERGRTTVYIDVKHPEANEAARIATILSQFELPPPARAANAGTPTFWYVSLFVCP